ncbi:recombinase family protein [Actinomadura geliboluensis]|uniref:recombinase family protein n=1 Tax=Actinomadura geliboluensis TaxID=882440 RepID=UPI0037137EF7
MFDAPIDLSDLPGYRAAADLRPPRTVFVGRVSTKDCQDPRSSIAGQVAEASGLLEPGEEFVGYYWDVESGMLGLDERSQIGPEAYEGLGVQVPRDGGLGELLEKVERGDSGIERAACERISRVARDMLTSLQVEHHFRSRGVAIVCANEPQGGMTTGQLEARRGAQVRAEIYRHELSEQSRRGQRQHAANGYRHGLPCYGYIAVPDPDAPPAANRFGGGRPKHRLALHPDPRRQETVQEVFRLHLEHSLGGAEIGTKLAANLERHPLDDGQAIWCGRRVRRMLDNPKYTGYQVWNRRSRNNRDRANPMSEWVWSRQKAHPELVSLHDWRQAQLVTARMRERRRSGWDRIRAVAEGRGLTLTRARESDEHVLLEVGGHQIVVPQGELPAGIADEVIALLAAIA